MNSFIAEIKSRLPQADWPVVVAALRSESQIWVELQDQDFAQRALDAAGADRDRWSPAFLGLLRLGQTQQFVALRSAPMQPVSEKLRYQAAAAFEKLAGESKDELRNPDLAQATLLALALRERRRLLNGWDQLEEDLSIASPEFWRLPISSLFGLMPNPHELLACLISADQSAALRQLGLHALVSNPLPPDIQSSHLLELINDFPLPQLMTLLSAVATANTTLARQVAVQALENLQVESEGEDNALAGIQRLLLEAEVNQISGQSDRAGILLRSAWEISRQFEAELADRLAESNGLDTKMISELRTNVDPRKVGTKTKRPASLLTAAKIALKSENVEESKEMARAALNAAIALPEGAGNRKAEILRDLSGLFSELQLPEEALAAAEAATLAQPNDATGALQLAILLQANGRVSESLQQAHLAAALAPNNGEIRRNLAIALAGNQQHEAAFQEWKEMLENEVEPTVDDWLSFAESGLHCNHLDETIKACQYALMLQPASGAAFALIGAALLAQGDEGSALAHLRRATELAPAQINAWLALAGLQLAHKDPVVALVTLISAGQFTTPNAKMQQLLGDVYQALDRAEEALTAYTNAAKLANEGSDTETAQSIALKISSLQLRLGYLDPAIRTLEAAQQSFPTNFTISTQFGKLLLANNQPKRALSALKQAFQADPENVALLMDIARAQLAVGELAVDAEQTLEIVLAPHNAPVEAKVLMAEAKAKQGKHSEAVHLYEEALQSPLGKDKSWNKQLALGKAHSQAASGKPVAAVSTLEALDKAQSGDLDIQRELCVCVKLAGRAEEAAQIAQKIYLANSSDEDSVAWYADLMESLGFSAQACKALSRSRLFENPSPRLILSLARLQWSSVSPEAALRTLARLNDLKDGEAFAHAGKLLLDRGAAQESIAYFKRALDRNAPNAEVLQNLAEAYLLDERWSDALQVIDQTIRLIPHKTQILGKRANVLLKLGKPQAALETIETSFQIQSNNAQLLALKSQILREQGDWPAALDAAAKAFELDPSHLGNLQTAAELAVLCLQPDVAREFFSKANITAKPSLELACLQAEMALDDGLEIEAAKLLVNAPDESHPRVMAMQGQLAACRGDRSQAAQLLQQAILAGERPADIFTKVAIAKAAERLNDWQTAISLYEELEKSFPGLVLAQFSLGRSLLLRAEWQQLCDAGQAKVKPEVNAFSKDARIACKKALVAAGSSATDPTIHSKLLGWQTRADLRFGAKLDLSALPQSYPSTAAEAAALFSAARLSGDLHAAEQRAKAFSNTPEVLVEKAIAVLEDDIVAALESIQQAAATLLQSAPVQALAACVAHKAGELVVALPFIQRALALWPDQPNWQALAGEIHQALGNLMEAKGRFSVAAQLEPNEGKHHFSLGKVLISIHHVDDGIQSLQQAIKVEPKNAMYSLALASAYRLAGAIKQAKSYAQQAQKLAPQNPIALHLQAELALEAGDPGAAKELTQQALKLAPRDSSTLRLLAESVHSLGETEKAIAILDRARETADDEVPILIRRAQLQSNGRGRGLDALIKLSQRYPDRGEVFFALSETLAASGSMTEAIQAAQRALKGAGKATSPALLANMNLHLAGLLKKSGNLDQSLHHLEQAAKLAPHSAISHIEKGRVFKARRQQMQAILAFQEAAALAPNDATPHFELGLLLKDAKDYEAAEAELRKAAKLAPKDRQIQRQLAAVIAVNFVHHPIASEKPLRAKGERGNPQEKMQELSL